MTRSTLACLTVGLALAACGDREAESAAQHARQEVERAAVQPTRVVALGRIRPATSIRVAGPARPSVVVGKLLVDEGDAVTAGQEVALLDSVGTERAEVQVWRAEVSNAEQELRRARNLVQQGVTSRAVFDQAQSRRDTAVARLEQAQAELARSHVQAPIDGMVLEVFARDGERVSAAGIVEIADTARMLAVAEVPESQIGGVQLGYLARVTSQSLPEPLSGRVTRVGSKVQQQEVVSADPTAALDSRIVEVEVELDQPTVVASRTNLRVEVEILFELAPQPQAPSPLHADPATVDAASSEPTSGSEPPQS